jgi:Fe-S-cluster containining protein
MSACNGRCCAVFHLSRPADKLDELRETVIDGAKIADMAIALTVDEAIARRERFEIPPPRSNETAGGWYTCRHWDEATRLCTIYEERPEMCRDYPYDAECEHGCGYVAPIETRAKWVEIRTKRREEAAA